MPQITPSPRALLLADAVRSCTLLAARYLAGFDDSTRSRQAPLLPNHPAWCLGHCALTMHRVAAVLDQRDLPDADFGPDASPARFAVDSVAFGSTPSDRPDRYPSLARCVEVYNAACERLAAAVASCPDERLDAPTPWANTQLPARQLVARMIFHNGFHTGQVADLRRALGLPSIFA